MNKLAVNNVAVLFPWALSLGFVMGASRRFRSNMTEELFLRDVLAIAERAIVAAEKLGIQRNRLQRQVEKLRDNLEAALKDRSAFAAETQTYRDAWLKDQADLCAMRKAIEFYMWVDNGQRAEQALDGQGGKKMLAVVEAAKAFVGDGTECPRGICVFCGCEGELVNALRELEREK